MAALAVGLMTCAASADEPMSVGVVITDGYGLASASLSQTWEGRVVTVLDRPGLVFKGGPALLADPQRAALLAAPDLLTASSYVNQVVPSRWLVDVSIGSGENPPMQPVLVDLSKQGRHDLGAVQGKTAEATLSQLADVVDGYLTHTGAEATQPVKGNVLSKLYHKADADHVQAENCLDFASADEARAHGYQPCSICFPRSHGLIQNDKTELSLGRELSSRIEGEYKLCRDEAIKARIDRIGEKLVASSDIRDFPYVFTVLDSEEVNAFSSGAGYVFITTGLLKRLESDDEVAAVLGHEMAHCENHHILRTYRSLQTMNIVGVIVGAATGGLGQLGANAMSTIFNRGYSRNFESQADHGGLLYAYAAGYDARAFVLTLKKLRDEEKNHKGGKPPAWLRTHPTEEKRIEDIQGELTALDGYRGHVKQIRETDLGLGDELQKHAAYYVDHPDIMQGFLTAYEALPLDRSHPMAASSPAPPPPTDPDARD